jgi:hypothetical protein
MVFLGGKMSIALTTEKLIPDLHWDFFARLLPGVVFIILYRYLILGLENVPSNIIEIVCLIFLGFVASLITQPIAFF